MRLPCFSYHAPTTLEEAFALLAAHQGDCRLFAGGTDVLPALKTGRLTCGHLIDLKRIEALTELSFEQGSGLRIGATATLTNVAKHAATEKHFPALHASIQGLATVQVRNKATVAGNLCNASPAADTATPLLAYGATAEVAGPDGARELPIEELLSGPGRTSLAATEILRAVRVPTPAPGLRAVYVKFSPRSKVDIAAVNLSAALVLDEEQRVERADIFLGTVAPVPMRAVRAQAALVGGELCAETIARAAAEARAECSPITDFRATAEYKRRIVEVLTRRSLESLARDRERVTK